jgi:hypothetical protein
VAITDVARPVTQFTVNFGIDFAPVSLMNFNRPLMGTPNIRIREYKVLK